MKKNATFTALSLALLAAAPALADLVYIESPLVTVHGETGAVGGGKYRLSHANFDQSLDRGTGTLPGNFISLNLGNNTALSARTYDFSFKHIADEGFIFSMTNTADNTTTTLSWGTFTVTPPGTNAALLNGFAPGDYFNALKVEARATRSGSSMSFSNLSFFAPALTIADGAFSSGTVTPLVGGPGDPLGFNIQHLVADVNLALYDWELTGTIGGQRDAVASGDEEVRFQVIAKVVDATIVPEPGTAALLLLGGLALLRRRVG